MRMAVKFISAMMLFASASCGPKAEADCRAMSHAGQAFTICSFSANEDIGLFLDGSDGQLIAQFDRLAEQVEADGSELVFAMNAGMYHSDRSPVGLYIEDGEERAALVTREGPGNFGMVPNGVFYIDQQGGVHVTETLAFADRDLNIKDATQSGPMLVIDGNLHPKFNPNGTSRKRRNGVGISANGETIHFAISDGFVTFHEFATLFRDVLETPNALYLDGTVSRMYAPQLKRNEAGLDMGPIIAIVR